MLLLCAVSHCGSLKANDVKLVTTYNGICPVCSWSLLVLLEHTMGLSWLSTEQNTHGRRMWGRVSLKRSYIPKLLSQFLQVRHVVTRTAWASPKGGSERLRGTYLILLESTLLVERPWAFRSYSEWGKFALAKCLSLLLSGCLITQIYREGLVNQNKREADSYRNY